MDKISNVEELNDVIRNVVAAQQELATFSQDKVDGIFRAAALKANDARIYLSKIAVEETGMIHEIDWMVMEAA